MFTKKQAFSKVIIILCQCVVLDIYRAPCKGPHYGKTNLCWPATPLPSAKTRGTRQRAGSPCTQDRIHGREKHMTNAILAVHHAKTLGKNPQLLASGKRRLIFFVACL
jgi:hypothetical protein